MKYVKKADIIYISALSIIIIAISVVMGFALVAPTSTVVIEENGEIFGTYNLAENQIIEVGEGNTVEIKDGKVFMIYANCPDQLCMHQPHLDNNLSSIVCLPNEVLVYLDTNEKSDDGIDVVVY